MTDLQIVITGALIILLVLEVLGYHRINIMQTKLEAETKEYRESFVNVASVMETSVSNQTVLKTKMEEIEVNYEVMRVVVEAHSELLNVQALKILLEKLTEQES